MIIDVDEVAWTHIATALKRWSVWCRENGIPVPADVVLLTDIARTRDRDRQAPTAVGDFDEAAHGVLMQSKLTLTYAAAAGTLEVSKRHVERLVAAGTLRSVDVGGAPRIRVADLEAYVASLAPGRRDFRADITTKEAS